MARVPLLDLQSHSTLISSESTFPGSFDARLTIAISKHRHICCCNRRCCCCCAMLNEIRQLERYGSCMCASPAIKTYVYLSRAILDQLNPSRKYERSSAMRAVSLSKRELKLDERWAVNLTSDEFSVAVEFFLESSV